MESAKQGSKCKKCVASTSFSEENEDSRRATIFLQQGSPVGGQREVLFPSEGLAPTREKEQHRIPFGEVQERDKVALI